MALVAFVVVEPPEPNVAGHLAYTYGILDHLRRRGHHIALVVLPGFLFFKSRGYSAHYSRATDRIYGRGLYWWMGRIWLRSNISAFLFRPFRQVLARLGRLNRRAVAARHADAAAGFDEVIGQFPPASELRHAARLLDRLNPDVVFTDTVFLSGVFDHVQAGAAKVVITHDIFHRRWQSLTDRGYRVSPPQFSSETEAELLSRFDAAIAIQPEEAQQLVALAPTTEVITAAMPITYDAAEPGRRVAGRFVFVGSDGLTNVDGLRWCITTIWPLIRQAVPQAELHVHGLACRLVGEAPAPGVVLHGYTPDLADAFAQATIALAPLRAGSGLKIKMLDYMRHGLPCVTTSVGASGFQRPSEWPFLVADEPTAFAEQAVRLCTDTALLAELRHRCAAYVQLYSAECVFAELDAAMARWTAAGTCR